MHPGPQSDYTILIRGVNRLRANRLCVETIATPTGGAQRAGGMARDQQQVAGVGVGAKADLMARYSSIGGSALSFARK